MTPTVRNALLSGMLCPLLSFSEVHDVPGFRQDKPDNCGPTAVTSCLGWFQKHGYPGIKTRGGKTGLDDIRKQIDRGSRSSGRDTDDHERTVDELGHAIEGLLQGGPYGKRLKAGKPGPTDLKDFRYLDSEFSHGEDIILLIRFGNNQGHFVTVRNITANAAGGRTIEYMDPAGGGTHTMDVSAQGAQLKLTYNGQRGFIENALTLSPANTTESADPKSVDPAHPPAGTKVTYRPFFPPHAVPRDLHILVSDCEKSHYTVTGLPNGWTISIQRIHGKCYLTFNRGTATTDLTSGQEIDVVYRGTKKFARRDHAVIQTSGGGTAMTSPLSDDPGQAIADREVERPGRVSGVICSVGEGSDGRYTARLEWGPVPGAAGYLVRDTYTGNVLGSGAAPAITLALQPDTMYSLEVAAELDDPDVTGEPSDPVVFYRDEAIGATAAAGGPQTLDYVSPLTSWHRPYSWKIAVPGAGHAVHISVTTVDGNLDPPLPPGVYTSQRRWYHFASDTPLRTGASTVEIPYNSGIKNPRMYALSGGTWVDATRRVDASRRMISGNLAALGSVAIVDVPASGSSRIRWVLGILVLLIALVLAVRSRRRWWA